MSTISRFLGKGLREPCSPNRTLQIFGSELNPPELPQLNCCPQITGQTSVFDLSTITPQHEVCVTLVTIKNPLPGDYTITIEYYKDAPLTQLFSFTVPFIVVDWEWLYAYAYIGWVPWEIDEDGDYHVEVHIEGVEIWTSSLDFKVIGIEEEEEEEPEPPEEEEPEPEPEPEPPSGFMATIISGLNDSSSFFYNAYLEVYDWVWPFNLLATPLYALCLAFNGLANAFYTFYEWVSYVSGRIGEILDWGTIWELILSAIPSLDDIVDWFGDWWTIVWNLVDDWWDSVSDTVQGWIDYAGSLLQDQISAVVSWLSNIQTFIDELEFQFPDVSGILDWFTDWTGQVIDLVDDWWSGRLQDVQGLIDSAIQELAPIWEDIQELKDDIVEFITDPWTWLIKKLEDWFWDEEEK